jgi:hypothetical protein
VELKDRKTGSTEKVPLAEAVDRVAKNLIFEQ